MEDNFVVSALKYRPATFDSVVGQAHITETLKNAIARGSLAHAYLFTGPRGVGKTTCARIFAKAINCLSPTADHEACGKCESCTAFAEGRSFSIHELDAASNNSVDDIRALTEKVRIPPQVGRYSLYIIDEVHMLSAGAFNAFLKTLEEPPAYAIFILATTEKHKILPTILSRCQCYDFNRIRVEDTVGYLRKIAASEGVASDDESLHIIAQLADGGMRDALSMFDRVVSFCGKTLIYDQVAASLNVLDYNTYFRAVDLILEGDYAQLLTLFDDILKRGFDGQLFLGGMGNHLRDLLLCKNPTTAPLLEVTGELAEHYRSQASQCEVGFLLNAIHVAGQADASYRAATNRRLHAELALIKLCGLKKKADGITDDLETLADTYPMPRIVAGGNPNIAAERRTPNVAAASPDTQPGPSSSVAPTAGAPLPATSPATASFAPGAETPAITPTTGTSTAARQPGAPPPAADSMTMNDPAGQSSAAPSPSNESPAAPKPEPAGPAARSSITGVSIAAARKNGAQPTATDSAAPQEEASATPAFREDLSPEAAEAALREAMPALIGQWNQRNRPRIATALTTASVKGTQLVIPAPTEVLQSDLHQSKAEIERDLLVLTGGVRATLSVEISEEKVEYKPVSVEDKLQFLIDKNPNILKLRDELDLTI